MTYVRGLQEDIYSFNNMLQFISTCRSGMSGCTLAVACSVFKRNHRCAIRHKICVLTGTSLASKRVKPK